MNGTLVGTVRGISPRMFMMLKEFNILGFWPSAPFADAGDPVLDFLRCVLALRAMGSGLGTFPAMGVSWSGV